MTPDFENPTDANLDSVYEVDVTVSDGRGGTDLQSLRATVTNVNDAPLNTVPGPQATNEDTPLLFSVATGNAIAINDADAGNNPVIVTLTATNGTLTLATLTGLTFGTGDGVADATMIFVGTLADINAALNGLRFDPTAGFFGLATLQVAVDDQGNVGPGGAKTDLDIINISVNPVNHAPVATSDNYTGNQFDTITILSAGVLVNDADPDGDAITAVLLQGPLHGTLLLQPDGSFSYVPDDAFSGSDTFQYRAWDGTLFSDPVTVSLQIDATAPGPGGGGDDDGGPGESMKVRRHKWAVVWRDDPSPERVIARRYRVPSSGTYLQPRLGVLDVAGAGVSYVASRLTSWRCHNG